MNNLEASTEQNFRDVVIRVADTPSAANHAEFRRTLPTATVFVKLIGGPELLAPGERFTVPKNGDVRTHYARLPNGMKMVRVFAASPREVDVDETVAVMTGMEVLRMVMRMPAQGLLVTAEDERNSWTAITREGIAAILKEQGH